MIFRNFTKVQSHLERLQDSVKAFPNSEDSGKKEASTSKKPPAVRLVEINKEIMNLMKHLSSLLNKILLAM